METYKEQAERRFNKTIFGMLLLAELAIGCGILDLVLGVREMIVEPATPLICSMAMTILGAGNLFLGGWVASFSMKRENRFVEGEPVIYEPLIGLVMGYILWLLGATLVVVAFFLCFDNDTDSMLVTIFSLVCMFCGALIFSDYRNRRIIISNANIEVVNFLGRKRIFTRAEVGIVKSNPATGGYGVYSKSGKRMFGFELNMINSHMLMQACSESFQELRKKEETYLDEINREIMEESQEANPAHDIRKMRHALIAFTIILVVLHVGLLVVYETGDILGGRKFFLIENMLPVVLFVFAWAFPQEVSWLSLGDSKENQGWKERHISIWWPQIILMMIDVFLVRRMLYTSVQCINGEWKVLLSGILIFFILGAVSYLRCTRKRIRQLQWLAIAIFSAYTAWGVTDSAYLAMSKEPDHYRAEVVDTSESRGRAGTSYYAEVILRDGKMKNVETSRKVYEEINNGGVVVVCHKTSLFDTEFVSLHLPD